MQRVRIGTCHGPTDASLVRSMLAAHDIRAIVNGEQHANLLGGLGGALIQLDIWVDAADAEQATALLRELREGSASEPVDDEPDDTDEAETSRSIETDIDKRRRFGVVLLLAFCITFGTAHMYMGAWAIGLLLAVIEIAAFTQLDDHLPLGASVVVGCVLVDALGAIARIRALGRVQLPRARAR